MTNAELMYEICTNRKSDVEKLFTGVEIDLFNRSILQATADGDKKRGEQTAELFVRTFNERIKAYNENVTRYNMSIYNGTHPALGKGIIDDTIGAWWRDIKRALR
jgi:hypothetical protein